MNTNGGNIIYRFLGDTTDLDKKSSNAKKSLIDLGKVGETAMLGVAAAVTGASAAIVGMMKDSIKAYANVEQSIGGVEKLFKDSANTVIENARKAYESAGIDANSYMEQVTSFSASLLQSLGGDTEKAANTADMAIIDMADNANKMGTAMENIQTAYQGFAKGQYQLLDNLKLGYGGTKGEMERLLADASKLSGVEYDISNLDDVYQAIHVIQGERGITGTTAKEANDTIIGSVNAAKAAWGNFLSGQGGIEQVIETFITAGKNISDVVMKMLPQIVQGIVGLLNGLMPMLPSLVKTILPSLIEGAFELIKGIIAILPDLMLAIAEMLPTMLPVIIDAFMEIIPLLIDMKPQFLVAGAKILGAILEGLIKSFPSLLSGVKNIGYSILNYFWTLPSTMGNIGKSLLEGLWNGIKGLKSWVLSKVKGMAKDIINSLKSALGIHSPSKEFAIIGRYSILGYTEQLDKMKGQLQDAVQDTFSLSPELIGNSSLHYSPNVVVNNNISSKTDSLGQVVTNIKTFANGAKNDYNYGMGV